MVLGFKDEGGKFHPFGRKNQGVSSNQFLPPSNTTGMPKSESHLTVHSFLKKGKQKIEEHNEAQRIKKMEEKGVISGYSAIINHKNLGLKLTAIMEIKTQKGKIIQAEKLLAGMKNVFGVYDVTGQTDSIVIAKFADTDMLSKFVKKLSSNPNIDNIHTHVVLNTIKEDLR